MKVVPHSMELMIKAPEDSRNILNLGSGDRLNRHVELQPKKLKYPLKVPNVSRKTKMNPKIREKICSLN